MIPEKSPSTAGTVGEATIKSRAEKLSHCAKSAQCRVKTAQPTEGQNAAKTGRGASTANAVDASRSVRGEAPSLSIVKQLHKERPYTKVKTLSDRADLLPEIDEANALFSKWQMMQQLAAVGIVTDPQGRMMQTDSEGNQKWVTGVSRSELRTAFTLGENTSEFFRVHPFEEVAFLTLSFPSEVKSPKEAGRRFDSFNSNWLRKKGFSWLRVCEPHKDKRPHYHMLIHLGDNVRAGFDFETFGKCQAEFHKSGYSKEFNRLKTSYVSAASPVLVDLWKELRQACKSAGLGRSELLPIKKKGEAVSQYVGKYIAKGSPYRIGDWKGARLVSYSFTAPKRASARFSWVKGGRAFRLWAAEVADCIGASHDTISELCGNRWGWRLHQAREAGLDASTAGRYLLHAHRLSLKL